MVYIDEYPVDSYHYITCQIIRNIVEGHQKNELQYKLISDINSLNQLGRDHRLQKLFFKVYYLPYRNSVEQNKNDGILHEGQNNIYTRSVCTNFP